MEEKKTSTWQQTSDGSLTYETTIFVTRQYVVVEAKPLQIQAYNKSTVEGTIISSRIIGREGDAQR